MKLGSRYQPRDMKIKQGMTVIMNQNTSCTDKLVVSTFDMEKDPNKRANQTPPFCHAFDVPSTVLAYVIKFAVNQSGILALLSSIAFLTE